ncbi:hypothetical protein HK101_002909 [Irineochytrium annulatum]|nr:hypothetical protein HK101_002909 [Irineochytrium annulatum]
MVEAFPTAVTDAPEVIRLTPSPSRLLHPTTPSTTFSLSITRDHLTLDLTTALAALPAEEKAVTLTLNAQFSSVMVVLSGGWAVENACELFKFSEVKDCRDPAGIAEEKRGVLRIGGDVGMSSIKVVDRAGVEVEREE